MGRRGLDLSALPEDCIENVFSLSGPQDTCRLSVISSLFRSAADSDAVWQKYLPPDYRSIIARSTDPSMPTRFSSLKDLYFSLCDNPILIDDAKLEEESREIVSVGALKWKKGRGLTQVPRYMDKPSKIVNLKVSPRTIHQPR